jgi:hypothetical protein
MSKGFDELFDHKIDFLARSLDANAEHGFE